MKLGTILGALSPGLSATGLFGDNAQKGGLGVLGAMSPLLGLLMLMKHKKKGGGDDGTGSTPPADPSQINVTQSPLLRAMPMMPPGAQQAPMRPPGAFPIPFGPGSQNPYGYGRY